MIEKELLLEIGKKKGLKNKEHIEKDYFQDLFLFDLFKKTNKFIFKGGTALYKLYKLPRFSEDLDFSLLENLDQKSIEDIVSDVVKQTSAFEITSVKKTKDSVLIKLGAKGILTKYNTLRIDVNARNSILKPFDVRTFVPEYIDINPFTVRSLNIEEIVAEKIHSIFMRKKARDLFDLFFLLRLSNFNLGLVIQKLGIFNMAFEMKEFTKRIEGLKELWERELRPFVLTDIFLFDTAKDFVLEKIKTTGKS